MKNLKRLGQGGLLMSVLMLATGCLVEPRNDHYDRDHHRYYHEHAWHECVERDEHCR
jgi:hypothetical protein